MAQGCGCRQDRRQGFRRARAYAQDRHLDRYDTKLQCGQCHVEYNCNPGYETGTGAPIGFADQRTNHFPFKDVNQIAKHYNDLKFRDFKHGITGALLWKASIRTRRTTTTPSTRKPASNATSATCRR